MKKGRIPTILGVGSLAVLMFLSVWMTSRGKTIWGSRAGSSCESQKLQVGNITDKSFSVAWFTDETCKVALVLDTDSRLFFDKRGENFKGKTHFVDVENLKASSSYKFQITSGGENYREPTMTVVTAKIPAGVVPAADLAWGKVFFPGEIMAGGTVVLLNIPQAAQFMALVSSDGNWTVPLSTSFRSDLVGLFEIPQIPLDETIRVMDLDGQIFEYNGKTDNNTPVPDIILKEEQRDLTGGGNMPEATSTPGNGQSLLGDLPTSAPQERSERTTLENPQEGEVLYTGQPEFFGEAPRGVILEIEVNSENTYQTQLDVGNEGRWSWSPPGNLEEGEHTITVKAKDPQTGLIETITRTFVVSARAAGDPAFVSTPSATLALPSPIVITSPTVMPAQPTAQPTEEIYRAAQIATDTAVPATGIVLPTIAVAGGGILLILAAAMLLF